MSLQVGLSVLLLVALAVRESYSFDNLVIEYAQYGACCVDQDPPIVRVEKLMIQARTRTVTVKQRIAARCGTFNWDSCTRYSTNLVPQQYYVQLYTHNTKYPPCKKFSCCDGFQQVLDKCIELSKFKHVVELLADWREKNPGSKDLKQGLAGILIKEKIFG